MSRDGTRKLMEVAGRKHVLGNKRANAECHVRI